MADSKKTTVKQVDNYVDMGKSVAHNCVSKEKPAPRKLPFTKVTATDSKESR
jgi:hypothetical protein